MLGELYKKKKKILSFKWNKSKDFLATGYVVMTFQEMTIETEMECRRIVVW